MSVPCEEAPAAGPVAGMSYSAQYDELYATPLLINRMVPKPSKQAQAEEPDGTRVPLSDVYATPKKGLFNRQWTLKDVKYGAFIGAMHLACLAARATFSWPMLALFGATYFVSGCLGITLAYHRMLSHRSFQVPK